MNAHEYILIVDDEAANLRLLAELLEKEGYRVRPAEKGQMAIDLALARPPSLILLDVRMPGMDGFEVCRRLEQDRRTRDVPIMFMSALNAVEDRAKGFEAGCVDFLSRPFQEQEVLARVRTHIRLRRLQLDLERLVDERTAEVRRTEERYELAIAGSYAGLFDWDIAANVLHTSDRLKELLGFGSDEISITMEWFWDRLHPDDDEAVRRALGLHLEQRVPYDLEYRLATKSGEYRWYRARAQALWDESGKPIRMAGSLTDITPRRQAERELSKSEERYRRLMEESPLGISIWTPDGKILEVNRAWMRTWDLNESEAARLIAAHNWLTDPQSKELGIMPLVEKAFAGDSVVLPPVEYSGARTTKALGLEDIEPRTMWIQVYLYSFKDEQGAVANVVAINMDITALKQAEREAREQRDALARVDRATRLGQLTGSIAHELNQPLTGILSNAQAAELMLENDRWQRDELAKVMSEIAADTKRAGAVIRGLRELYREHKGDFSQVDVNTVVADTTRLLHSEMVLQQVEFTTECATSLPKVNGNSVQIQQVLVNLIMNSIQAMGDPPRRGRLVRVVTALQENEVIVWVEDSGPGIDPDYIDRIFEPLATWKPGGTGMGLPLSNSIIEAHGGRMWAENSPDGGARVGFAIPVPH